MSHDIGTLGFIGLGAMGSRMARNLLNAGYELVGFDIDTERLTECEQAGAKGASSASEVVERADVVLTSLTTSDVFQRVAESELIPNAREGQVFIEHGTTRPPMTRRLSADFAERGGIMLDAPVSGGADGAKNGTLRMWVGGDEPTARRCWELFEIIADPRYLIYAGPSGCGQIMKCIQQLSGGLAEAVQLELVAFGRLAGLPMETLAAGMKDKESFLAALNCVRAGKTGEMDMKYGEWGYALSEAGEKGFRMPVLEALSEFLKDAPHEHTDGQGRAYPSLWDALLRAARPGKLEHE
ncbi:MAG: NAD(P)-dependent oxidoreductase [Phycisphaerae bacterium]